MATQVPFDLLIISVKAAHSEEANDEGKTPTSPFSRCNYWVRRAALLSQSTAWEKHRDTAGRALCWGMSKAVLAWGPSPGLVFEFSCQSRTSQALQGEFIWGQLNRCWTKHWEEQHPWPRGDFSPPQCWLSCVEAQMGLKWPRHLGWGMGRHLLRAAQPRGVPQICFGTHGPGPGNAPLAFSLIASSWFNPHRSL